MFRLLQWVPTTGLRILFGLAVLVLAGQIGLWRWVATAELPPLVPEVSTVVEDRNGQLLRGFTVADGRWRLPVEVHEVSRNYLDQLIAFEDKRFYRHGGVDLPAMIRAATQAIRHGEVVSGGSTLTMQVARLLEDSGTGRWTGKWRQIRVALALESRVTKDEILRLYLRLAPFGGNIEGVRAASLLYFQKEPSRLTEAEAALLVALPQRPTGRRPDRHPKAAKAARDRVLARAAAAGVISAETAQASRQEPVPTLRRDFTFLAPHLTERMVAENPLPRRHRLTIDATIQARAETLVRAHVRNRQKQLSAAVMVVDHKTGEVLASVGSPDYFDETRQGFVDMTRSMRSPGSTLKPLIFGLAFDAGRAHPETLINDAPMRFGPYAPQNFDKRFRGQIRVREALQLSLNLPAVQLLEAVGPAVLISRLERAGAEPKLTGSPGLAVGLGGLGVSLRDLVAIYASFPRGGRAVELVERLEEVNPQFTTPRIVGPVAAWYVSDILSGVTPPPGAPRGIAYKTGTSYGYRDAWAIGYDGTHVVGVWLGRADAAAMPGNLGLELAAPLLFDVFSAIGQPEPLPAPPPQALTVANRDLPSPLRQFRRAGQNLAELLPEITHPPDGVRVAIGQEALVVKVGSGTPPFTWLANGTPVNVRTFEREAVIESPGPGALDIAVIDSTGASSRITISVVQ